MNAELLSAGWLGALLIGATWRLRSLVAASGGGRQWIPWLFLCCLLTLARMGLLAYRYLWSSMHISSWLIPVIILLLSLFVAACLSMMLAFVESEPRAPKIWLFVGAVTVPLFSLPFLRFDAAHGSRIATQGLLLIIPYVAGTVALALYALRQSRNRMRNPMVFGCTLACFAVCLSACYDAILVQSTGVVGTFTTAWVQALSLIALMLLAEGLLSREFVQRSQRIEAAKTPVEEKARLFAMMSHELRTPLSSIIGIQEALRDRLQSDDQRELIQRMSQAAGRLSRLIDGVVTVERFAASRQVLDERPFALRRLFERGEGAVAEGFNWVTHGRLDQWVVGDDRRLRQALEFLHDELSAKGGVDGVHAEARIAGGADDTVEVNLCLSLRPQRGEKLTSTGAVASTSLAVAERLFRLVGVELITEGTSENGISCRAMFRFRGVSSVVELTAEPGPVAVHQPKPSKTILIVDDHEMNRRVVRLLLEPTGCAVQEASGGLDAMQQVAQQRFDAILIDLHMPGMSGLELVTALKKQWHQDPIASEPRMVAWSADQRAEMVASAYASGFSAFLTKPYSKKELLQVLELEGAGAVPDVGRSSNEHHRSSQFLLDLVGGDLSLARALVDEFESTWREADAHMTEEMEGRDWAGVASVAHRQRGGCLSLGLNEAAETAGQLQMAAEASDEVRSHHLISALRAQCENAVSSLRRILDELAGGS